MRNSASTIRSTQEFLGFVLKDSERWPLSQPRWFRGEPDVPEALVPSLYRGCGAPKENQLLQMFRMKAPAFGGEALPDRDKTDQWLFLARHVGLPTRLLDWTENALVALYFAVNEARRAVVWMLNPLQLNHLANPDRDTGTPGISSEFPLPWHRPDSPGRNIANENIRGAWELDRPGVELPVAVHPTYVHPRISAQRGCFTVHGKRKEGLHKVVPSDILKRYPIDPNKHADIRWELRVLGMDEATAFPDLDGLARELKARYFTAS